ncbi:adenylate/guanylate cyclase domain-containing protein [Mycolicibacterium sp. 018/SC-01/001]|uniref:adenylate/guanylate cyclase domain-containing protein n=1 Tax=Mycolicibacterium sp. 018/SC-01/001 TaxID=2592069 RepID=UPI00117D04BB|nr:adenylate/guanylate cyclase domain-containing protein [Mycolicibacterium sp. 018/SC-01/001]TRW82806.1 adenylate/guanylate cyclase domain-containing protein [Mycolicibacterium sp. 018/SC-01/001]
MGFWQQLWDRYGRHYSWAIIAVGSVSIVPAYTLFLLLILGYENSHRYGQAVAVAVFAGVVVQTSVTLYGRRWLRPVERWAAGEAIDRVDALEGTYVYVRKVMPRIVWGTAIWNAAMGAAVGLIADASTQRVAQYALLGACFGVCGPLITARGTFEAAMRPLRSALAGDSDCGDGMPRSRPTFAWHATVCLLAAIFQFTMGGAMLASVFSRAADVPALAAVFAFSIAIFYGIPLAAGSGLIPSLRPIRDLLQGADRVAAGDYSQRLPVVQDDDLGALVGSFNRMQAGLAQRQQLQVAFGAYVDPVLAARLLEQSDEMFSGERRVVTVMFLDVRDFTPFSEANAAEDVVTRLNELFAIVVPAVVAAGGHVNKFMGDGVMAVFGAPNELVGHADVAVSVADEISRRVAQRFGGEVRIGIGINTGEVVAGTIGAAGHLEFAVIGDTTNVAARVEQLTKTTGDTVLVTGQCVDTLTRRPPGLVDRGAHGLKGKSAPIRVYGLTGDLGLDHV